MKKRTKRLLSGIALALGALSAARALIMKRKNQRGARADERRPSDVWARPGMRVTFRAELMPGRDASERTFRVTQLLPSGRVLLEGRAGEHAEREFERVRY